MSLKRSRQHDDLASLAPPRFAASSDAKRRKGATLGRRQSVDCLSAMAGNENDSNSMDVALLSAYMVDHSNQAPSMEEEAPAFTGSWAGHSAQMAFLFGQRAPPPRPRVQEAPSEDYDASDDELTDEGDVNRVARAFARGHRLRRGFFASALRRRLQTLQETNARLKALAREHLSEDERSKLFAELGSEDNAALESRDTSMDRTDLCLMKVIQEAQRSFCVSDPRLPDNPIVWASDAFLRMTGYARDEVVGRNCRFLQGPKTDSKQVDQIRSAVAEERECLVTLLNYRKDGQTFWNQFFIAPLKDSEGRVTYYVGVQVDVSETTPGR